MATLWSLCEAYNVDFIFIAQLAGHVGEHDDAGADELLQIAVNALAQLSADARIDALQYIERLSLNEASTTRILPQSRGHPET